MLSKSESDLYPFALVISLRLQKRRSTSPNWCSCSVWLQVVLVGNSECGWANPRFRLPYWDGGWLRVDFVRLHCYLGCLQLVILASLKLVILFVFLRREDRATVSSFGIKAIVATVGISLPLATYICYHPIYKSQIKITYSPLCDLLFWWVLLSLSPLESCLVADHIILCVSFVSFHCFSLKSENLKKKKERDWSYKFWVAGCTS